MRFGHARGPVLVGLWAFAPPLVVQESDTTGALRVTFGASAGQYEVVSRSCSGEVLSSTAVPYRTAGALVEWEASDAPIRISGFGGYASYTDSTSLSGSFVGGQIAYEGGPVGFGIGGAVFPRDELPSVYIRGGPRDGLHGRLDMLAPTAFPGSTGFVRTGLGFPVGRSSLLVGVAGERTLGVEDGEYHSGPFVEGEFALGAHLDAVVGLSYFGGETETDWGAGVGLRYRVR